MDDPALPDHVAFTAMYRKHYGAVLSFVRRRTPGPAAEDVVAEVFTTAWRRLEDVPADPRPWLYGVARNTLLSDRRGSARRTALAVRIASRPTGPQADHTDEVAQHVDLAAAWLRLSVHHQEALALVTHDGLTGAEAAQVLGCTRSAFSVRLVRARRALRAFLEIESRTPASRHVVPVTPKEAVHDVH